MIDYNEEVKKIIASQFQLDEEELEDDSSLETDLNISELDLEDLVARLEEKYQIEIPQSTYENFKTIGDIAAFLYENIDRV